MVLHLQGYRLVEDSVLFELGSVNSSAPLQIETNEILFKVKKNKLKLKHKGKGSRDDSILVNRDYSVLVCCPALVSHCHVHPKGRQQGGAEVFFYLMLEPCAPSMGPHLLRSNGGGGGQFYGTFFFSSCNSLVLI